MNPDLLKERQNASFDTEKLTNFFYMNAVVNERRRFLQKAALNDKFLQSIPKLSTLDREEQYTLALKRDIYIVQKLDEMNITEPFERLVFKETVSAHENSPIGLHPTMFIPVIKSQATEEQKAKWLPRAEKYEILGTYAQTEMGHGTFIRGLETTATYDPDTEEFIMNSPTISSAKYWPGNLGKTTNYAVVMAQLYTKGHCHGVHAFMVQTRSEEDHMPLPGVELGDIGAKFGYNTNDNGFLRFHNVRIPRENMLMKYSKVLKDGTYQKPVNSKLLYGAMVQVRAIITIDVARALSQTCTIAIRYSAVRRQTEVRPGGTEAQVLDYQTQQQKLFPLLAASFALFYSGRSLLETFFRVSYQIEQGALEEVPQLHALSAGLKAFSSWAVAQHVEVCRMACGGHGYSLASGIPKIYMDIAPACTYEGENTVMALQAARYLVKCISQMQQGQQLPGFVSYLSENFGRVSKLSSQLELSHLVEAYEHRAARQVKSVAEKVQRLIQRGKKPEVAWNLCSVQLVKAAMAHCNAFVVKTFCSVIEQADELDASVRKVLKTLCQLYCVNGILESLGDFMKDGFINASLAEMLENRFADLLAAIRPDAVAIVDSFDIPDSVLDSALGRYDGNVYEAMYNYAKESSLNKTQVHSSYHKYIRPLLKGEKITDSKL